MAGPVLVPCLVQLRTEFDTVCPARSTASDGWIGDEAHQQTVSDHNDDERGRVPITDADRKREVHALDVTAVLNQSDLTMRKVVDHLLYRCRVGVETRLRYIIFDGMIWEASNGWRKRAYTGANKHRQHAHFSASYDTRREADTRSWTLEEIPVSLTDADKKWLDGKITAAAKTAAEEVWKKRLNIAVKPGQKANLQEAGSILRYVSSEHHDIDAAVGKTNAGVVKVDTDVTALQKSVNALIVEIKNALPTSAD